MIANHIHDALAQVRELQKNILDKQRFKGYSGRARAIAGTVALIAAVFLSISGYPETVKAHLLVWAVVFAVGFVLNYGALIHWFLFDPSVQRDFRKLRPTLEALPALFVGGALTFALVKAGQVQLLFGMWMLLFGVTCMATRQSLPRIYWVVGVFYLACGVYFLLTPNVTFLNPWPMGIVFFVGEWLGGIIFHYDDKLEGSFKQTLLNLFKRKGKKYAP